MNDTTNPLLCDPQTGVCEVPETQTGTEFKASGSDKKPIKVIYYTDPICSSCWGIEPQLRKLKLEYGHILDIEYHMGGLLPDWSYNSGGISKPSDVAHHWDEVSLHYDMPIDGDVWLEDPLDSSYPPSIAFKAAELQDHTKAILFLREMREMVFMQKKNIAKWENMEEAARRAGLDIEVLKTDYEGKAVVMFNNDLKLGKELGVRGFPTMFFTDTTGQTEMVYGTRPYEVYEAAILKLEPSADKYKYDKGWQSLFLKYSTLTAKEFAELSGIERTDAENQLKTLVEKGFLVSSSCKNGSMWRLK